MTSRRPAVIDIDAHYLEPVSDLTEYMEDPWRTVIKAGGSAAYIPRNIGDLSMGGRIQREELPIFKSGVHGGEHGADSVKATQAKLGLDASILVSNWVISLSGSSQRDVAVAYYNAYIDHMLERVVDAERGVYTVPVLSWQEPEASARIIERVAGHPAVVGVCLSTSGANPPLGDERYNPIYAAAERHGLPVILHGNSGLLLRPDGGYADGLQRLIEAHCLGFSITNLIQLTSVLLRGTPERFPGLKFVFMEAGLFWVPMAMYRLDEYFLKRRSEAPLLKALPSEYVRDRFYFGTQPLESPKDPSHLQAVMEMIGYEHILFASDYPHFDYDHPSAITNLRFISAADKAKILGENAIEVFGLCRGGRPAWLAARDTGAPTGE